MAEVNKVFRYEPTMAATAYLGQFHSARLRKLSRMGLAGLWQHLHALGEA